MRKYVMEGIGTFFLVLAIGLSGNPLAIGLMLAAMVYLGGHISGGHYNPAVTFAVWLRGKLDRSLVLGYMVSQVIGAFLAASVISFLGSSFFPEPAATATVWQALVVEIIFTFVLASVILTVATTKALKGNMIYGLAIGLTLTTIVYAGGSISGGAYNPAVFLGPMVQALISSTAFSMNSLLLYIVGPLVGGFLAAVIFKYVNPKE